jgi:hypothetical protein
MNKRNILLVAIAAAIGIVVVINPLQYLRGSGAKRPAADPAVLGPLRDFAVTHWKSPEDYVVGALASHDIVFLGEFYRVRQDVQLAAALVPRLYAAGVRIMGVEYALSDDQPAIDALVNAPRWDEMKARHLLFDWMVTWGYQEYVDLFKAAWALNRGLPRGAPPFRLLGLGVKQDWQYVVKDSDARDPAVVAKIYANGTPDAHMAGVVLHAVAARGEKALVFCGMNHVFTRWRSPAYLKYVTTMHLAETRLAGGIIRDAIGDRVFSIGLHAPWPDSSQKSGLGWAAGGVVDELIAALPEEKRSGGWDTAGTPLGNLPVKSGAYAEGSPGLTIAALFDGYVVQGPLAGYAPVTPIRDFVRPEDAAQAAAGYPGVKPTAPTVAQVNQSIVDEIQVLKNTLSQFK